MQLDLSTASGRTKTVAKNLHVDMTPMVDLGFLLITFFILTTALTERHTMSLNVPKEAGGSPVKASNALSIILAEDNKAFVYNGRFEDALASQAITQTNYNVQAGIGKLIREKINLLNKTKGTAEDMVVMVKPMNNSSYKNVVDALDEMLINGVMQYAVVKVEGEEEEYVKTRR